MTAQRYRWGVRPPAPRVWITAALVAVATGLLAIAPYALLVMLPALLLAWLVALGWFTGERAIELIRRVARRRVARRESAAPLALRAHPSPASIRGGLLLGCSLASRPPPAFA